MTVFHRLASAIGALVLIAAATGAYAMQEFPPPQGKGRIVVVFSGASGPEHYTPVAKEIAKLGYDVVLYDSNTTVGTKGAAVKQDIIDAQQAPHGLPGKVAVVGFSLGGGMSIIYASLWPDLVQGVVAWYPETTVISDVSSWAGRTRTPMLMFAGESDTYKDCCLIGKAHALEAAASQAGLTYQLVTYPNTDHDFVIGGSHYNSRSYADAFKRTAAKLQEYFAN